jgi:hypothetical protein
MTKKQQKREEFLISKGFRQTFLDGTMYWFEKNIKINEFKGKLISDDKFHFIEIETLDYSMKRKEDATIWVGSWNKFLDKINKYK